MRLGSVLNTRGIPDRSSLEFVAFSNCHGSWALVSDELEHASEKTGAADSATGR